MLTAQCLVEPQMWQCYAKIFRGRKSDRAGDTFFGQGDCNARTDFISVAQHARATDTHVDI